MLYYFPEVASYIILSIDVISILLFIMVLRTRPSQRIGGIVLISVFIIPFMTLKLLPSIDFLASTPGKLSVVNNSKLFSPVYYLDNNGNIIWIFLTVKGISVSEVFDVEGRTRSMVVVKKNGNYGYVDLEYIKYSANVEINEDNLRFDKNEFLTEMLNRNIFPIIANYLSHIVTFLFLLLVLYQILLYLRKRLNKLNNQVREISEISG